MLANLTENSGRVLSVEPDQRVHAQLLSNREAHRCNFHLLRGSLGTSPLSLLNRGDDKEGNYGSMFRVSGGESGGGETLPHMTFREAERYLGGNIDTLLIDCEGCLGSFLDGQEELLDTIDLLLLEEDMLMIGPRNESYEGRWFDVFRAHGLKMIWRTRDSTAPRQHWSRILRHSAWSRSGLAGRPSCREYAQARSYGKNLLNCIV